MMLRVLRTSRPFIGIRSCPQEHEQRMQVQIHHDVAMDQRIAKVQQQIQEVDQEAPSFASMDLMEELLATLSDLKYKKKQGPALIAIDECEPSYNDSVEYDV